MMAQSFCACGCEKLANEGRVYITGHNSRRTLRKPRIEKTCLFCKTVFSGTLAAIGKRKYCSSTCRDNHRRTMIGPLNPSYMRLDLTCEICNKPFSSAPARSKNHQVYCSMECGREGRRRKISGVARKKKPFGTHAAKVRDQFSCRICGFDVVVEAHHIVPKMMGGDNHVTNIITLCPNHHKMAHAGLISAENMREAIQNTLPPKRELRLRAVSTVNFRTIHPSVTPALSRS